MTEQFRALLKPKDLTKISDENLFTLLEDIQKSTEHLFMEAWRRGIHTELASHAMTFKAEVKMNESI